MAADSNVSIQVILLASTVAGGVFAAINGLIRVVEKTITTRKNGNGNSAARQRHEDMAQLHGDLHSCSEKLQGLVMSAQSFDRSHIDLHAATKELILSQRAMQQQFTVFMVKFSAHLDEFKCLGQLTRDKQK